MDNLKDSLQYAVELALANAQIFEISGKTYSNKTLQLIEEPQEERVYALEITTLTGFIDYIKQNRDGLDLSKTILQITGAASAALISIPNKDKKRETYISACAVLPKINYSSWYDREDFNILLQSAFLETEHRDMLLKYVSHIKEDENVSVADDGVSQRIIAHTGVASVDNVILPNPVILKPYRTFQELEQTESQFIFRIQKGGKCALFEADGGMWKIECRARIKQALSEAFKDNNEIVIIG